jgi:predicted N-acetyltransferase YhbS
MRIVSYDEADHDEVLAMNLQAFGWPLTEATAKKYLEHDERWMDVLGLYAVEGGKTIGQVLPLKIRTRTSQGEEIVGGIAGVTVNPAKAKGGVATALMKATHAMFRENNIRICFLLTAESLVAYGLYLKLGYFDAASFCAAQKFVKTARRPRTSDLRTYRKKDSGITDEIYRRGTRGLLGFVLRQPAFLNMKMDTTPLTKKNIRMAEGGSAEGYVVLTPAEEYVTVREIICPNERSFNTIMATVEAEAAGKYILTYFQTPRPAIRRFEKRGYKPELRTWGRIMAAPIVEDLSKRKLRELYDFGGRFCMMALDTY